MIKNHIKESIEVKNALLQDSEIIGSIEKAIAAINDCFKNGNKVLIAGNGGSAADAQHFSAEIVGKYKLERKGYPAIALTTNSSIITAWSNDYNFEGLFARQIEALGQAGDIFIGISTSGNSQNIIEAINKAKDLKIKTICLLGKNGGELKNSADISIVIPSGNTPRIQEAHIMLLHIICEEIEKKFI